jgi:hypothetical protein
LYHRELASILDYQSVISQDIQDKVDSVENRHDGKFTFNKKEREILRLSLCGCCTSRPADCFMSLRVKYFLVSRYMTDLCDIMAV